MRCSKAKAFSLPGPCARGTAAPPKASPAMNTMRPTVPSAPHAHQAAPSSRALRKSSVTDNPAGREVHPMAPLRNQSLRYFFHTKVAQPRAVYLIGGNLINPMFFSPKSDLSPQEFKAQLKQPMARSSIAAPLANVLWGLARCTTAGLAQRRNPPPSTNLTSRAPTPVLQIRRTIRSSR